MNKLSNSNEYVVIRLFIQTKSDYQFSLEKEYKREEYVTLNKKQILDLFIDEIYEEIGFVKIQEIFMSVFYKFTISDTDTLVHNDSYYYNESSKNYIWDKIVKKYRER